MIKVGKVIVATAVLAGGFFGAFTTNEVSHAAPVVKTVNVQHQKTIKDTVNKAKQGKTINSDKTGVGSTSAQIKKRWGKPDAGSDKENLYYSKWRLYFQLEHDKTVSLYSNDKRFDNITVQEVKKEAGQKPYKTRSGADAYYLDYKEGKYTLTFGFYYDDHGKPSTLKEVSVSK
ncbi:protein of unknown function [Seinonella peptonophila]|uniref:DUF4309 domain-containing protein n=1 Tax=Seinonella peptonophila TaxID=112248 RepID=A0A1M4X1N8_9BACL|nr:DUF4309 domain-containing protein [Seinonella peptonophila]SHE87122.1 protein of unknown function [Seinonella peptonophila]